jgi:hypothetical protein
MKDGLHVEHFTNDSDVTVAVTKRALEAKSNIHDREMQGLFQWWIKYVGISDE